MKEFENALGFVEHLLVLKAQLHLYEHHGLEKACRIIEEDAREQIGHYQAEVGKFPEWAPLADSTEAEKARLGYDADAPLLREGDLRDSFSHEVRGSEGVVGSTDPVMEFHEFGTSKMPPRPVLGPALYKNIGKIEEEFGKVLVEAIVGGELTPTLEHFQRD